MPRQDVPYGGAICRLKERIAEIWDELGKKLHSINGVEGDAAGDVKIVSGDAAIVVTSDQVNHQIEVALDSSQLPAAAVSSVNGQTGAVALTADDIPSDNGDVQTDIDNLEAADTTLQGNINAEALARANADSTLQSNINTLSASLPAAAAAAVAADPTVALLSSDVAQLQSEDSNNVKLAGSQTITGNKDVPTQATGTYSQQIANSNKVYNELQNYPTMVRTANNQTISGIKSFNQTIQRLGPDFRTDNYNTPVASQNIQMRNSSNVYTVAGDDITQSAANTIYRDIKISLSTDGSAINRSDAILRLIINNSTGEARLQLFTLTYVNGSVTRSAGSTIATLTP